MESLPGRSKDFSELQDVYQFFEDHVSERAETLTVWSPFLNQVKAQERIRLLDFGCGNGSFTAQVLERLGEGPDRLDLRLVEPVEGVLQEAVTRLESWTDSPIVTATHLGGLPPGQLDLILSHHVLYYVDELEQELTEMKRRLALGGVVLAVVGGSGDGPGALQDRALEMAGLSSPYRSGEEIRALFEDCFSHNRVIEFPSEMRIPDRRECREAIMRFLVGEFSGRVPWEKALALFDPFRQGDEIVVPSREICLVGQAV